MFFERFVSAPVRGDQQQREGYDGTTVHRPKEIDMLSDKAQLVAKKAKKTYEEQLRKRLESSDHGHFVCIEPQSGDFFLGDTFDEAVNQAIDAHPDCLTHTFRVGHVPALHIGILNQ